MTLSSTNSKPLLLPRGGFHYSCYVSWQQSKEKYKDRFFREGADLLNKSMQFGSYVMYLLEFDPLDETVADIPSYGNPEYPLTAMLNGNIPIVTHPDDINVDGDWGIYEYKTALWRGKPQWTTTKVYNWVQIPFYCMAVREKIGWYNAYNNFIVEIPTRRITEEEIGGVKWKTTTSTRNQTVTRAIDDKGDYLPALLHRRIVPQKEIDDLRENAIRIANEISSEYINYLKYEINF